MRVVLSRRVEDLPVGDAEVAAVQTKVARAALFPSRGDGLFLRLRLVQPATIKIGMSKRMKSSESAGPRSRVAGRGFGLDCVGSKPLKILAGRGNSNPR